jgi:hypothetical protein
MMCFKDIHYLGGPLESSKNLNLKILMWNFETLQIVQIFRVLVNKSLDFDAIFNNFIQNLTHSAWK